jgi:hypothetical protein
VWNAAAGACLNVLKAPGGAPPVLALSPDARFMASTVKNGRISIWGAEQ